LAFVCSFDGIGDPIRSLRVRRLSLIALISGTIVYEIGIFPVWIKDIELRNCCFCRMPAEK
jgi:hypothetical protein